MFETYNPLKNNKHVLPALVRLASAERWVRLRRDHVLAQCARQGVSRARRIRGEPRAVNGQCERATFGGERKKLRRFDRLCAALV